MKETVTPDSKVTKRECGGLSVPAFALLLVPGLIALMPSLSSVDVAGLFNLSFREVKQKLDDQKKQVDQVASDVAAIRVTQQTLVSLGVNLHVYQNAGDVVARGAEQTKSGAVRPLEELK